MRSILPTIRDCKEIESLLEYVFGAKGKGLQEKTASVGDKIDPSILKSINHIAKIRQSLAREANYEIDDYKSFLKTCADVLDYLHLQKKEKMGRIRLERQKDEADIDPNNRADSLQSLVKAGESASRKTHAKNVFIVFFVLMLIPILAWQFSRWM